jgi:hypothetical protein
VKNKTTLHLPTKATMTDLNYQQRKKRWEQQRREQQRQRLEKNSIINLPKDMIHEIFDKDPKSGLMLANTNKWFNVILKNKIKKHRQLIRECNVAALCYHQSLCNIRLKAWIEDKNYYDYVTPNLFCIIFLHMIL